MAIKVQVPLADTNGVIRKTVEGTVRSRASEFAVTRFSDDHGYNITHRRTGASVNSLLPISRADTVAEHLRIIAAWEDSDLDLSAFAAGEPGKLLPKNPPKATISDMRQIALTTSIQAYYERQRNIRAGVRKRQGRAA